MFKHTNDLLSDLSCCASLQGSDRGKAKNVGMYSHETLFQYEKDCGILVPISRIKPVVPSSLSPSRTEPSGAYSDPQTDELSPGDRVIYFIGPKCRSGMVVEVQQQNGNQMVWISTVSCCVTIFIPEIFVGKHKSQLITIIRLFF